MDGQNESRLGSGRGEHAVGSTDLRGILQDNRKDTWGLSRVRQSVATAKIVSRNALREPIVYVAKCRNHGFFAGCRGFLDGHKSVHSLNSKEGYRRTLIMKVGENAMSNNKRSLKILSNVEANCDTAANLANALLSDQPELSKKVCRALFCGHEEATRAITEAVKFIWLAADSSNGRLSPAHRVDLAWHELILFTRTYQQLCEENFGKFVHHQPEAIGQESEQQFSKTINRYWEAFGAPPQEFWGTCDPNTKANKNKNKNTSDCGTCESTGE